MTYGTETVAGFMTEARAMLAGGITKASLDRVGKRLAEVGRQAGFVAGADMQAMHGGDSSFEVLQTDPDGLTLVLGRFSADDQTPVHDHNSWGVACVIEGIDHYRQWEVAEDGRLNIVDEKDLRAGAFVTWLDPPHDIHSQQGVGEPALELILFGKNVMTLPRRYYDPKTGGTSTALPG